MLYYQTSEFTCGAAAALMAMAKLNPAFSPTQLEEYLIWREACTVYMGEGHSGTSPYGLALVLEKRGFRAEVITHNAHTLFENWTHNKTHKAVMKQIISYDKSAAAHLEQTSLEPLSITHIQHILAQGGVPITLTHNGVESHWVVVDTVADNTVTILNPWIEPTAPKSGAPEHYTVAEFEKLLGKKRKKDQAIIAVYKP